MYDGAVQKPRMPTLTTPERAAKRFCLILVKPSHYDDDGYVIQWFRSTIPSNSLAAVYGLARDCAQRHVLGDDVDDRDSSSSTRRIRASGRNIWRA